MKHDKPIFSRSQEGATLQPYTPTAREKTESVIREFLNKYTGLGRGVSRDTAQFITGTTDPSQGMVESLGVLDFTPVGVGFAGQEAARDFGKAQDALDYVAPSIGLGLSIAEALPLTKVITKPLGSFLSNLSKKAGKETPVDLSRRGAITKIAAAPVAIGALSEVPVKKIVDDFDFLDEVDKIPMKKQDLIRAGVDALPSFKKITDRLDAQYAVDILNDTRNADFVKRTLNDLNIDINNFDRTQENLAKLGKEFNARETFPMSNTEYILEQEDDIRDYLKGRIELDDIKPQIELSDPATDNKFTETINVAKDILTDLTENYQMSKDEIAEFLDIDMND